MNLKQCNMATGSWDASADKAQMPCLGKGGGAWPPSRGQGPIGLGSALLIGWGSGPSCFLSCLREASPAKGFSLEQFLPVRPCVGRNDKSLSSSPPPKCSDTCILGTHCSGGLGQSGPRTASGESETGTSIPTGIVVTQGLSLRVCLENKECLLSGEGVGWKHEKGLWPPKGLDL